MNSLTGSIVILAAVSLSSTSILNTPSADGNFELLILHNNDMHARFEQTSQLSGACTQADSDAGRCYGGFPRVAHVVKEARRKAATGEGPPVLYLNAGDTYTGTAWFTIYKWRIAAEFINALQPDAVSLGNHEFDEDIEGPEGVVNFIGNLTSPVLAANLILDEVPELAKQQNLYKSKVLVIGNNSIGVIGYLTPETKFLAPKNKVDYEDEIIAIRKEVAKLKKQGVNILIALGHSGFPTDVKIARNVEDIDLVIGGHTNTFLWNSNTTDEKPEIIQGPYPKIVIQPSGRKVLVVQAYAYTKYMGKLHLVFNSNGEIVNFDGTPILLNQKVPRDPELLQLVDKYREKVSIVSSEVVGTSMVLLNGGEECRIRECNMGNLINDAMLYYTKLYGDPRPDIAVTQGGRIRSSILSEGVPFNVTRGDLINVLPFSDSLTIITINGSTLLEALEHSVDLWRPVNSYGQFLQFSGMRVTFDLAKPIGLRVVEVKAKCTGCDDLVDVKESYNYTVLTSVFLGDGGDNYTMFESLPKEVVPYNEVNALLKYFKEYSPVNPSLDGRLITLNEDKAERNLRKSRLYTSNKGAINKLEICLLLVAFVFSI